MSVSIPEREWEGVDAMPEGAGLEKGERRGARSRPRAALAAFFATRA